MRAPRSVHRYLAGLIAGVLLPLLGFSAFLVIHSAWREQEMIAQIEESRAKVVEAEAEVPRAIAQAFQEGVLGILDYYKLRNVQADTDMRVAIARISTPASASAKKSAAT